MFVDIRDWSLGFCMGVVLRNCDNRESTRQSTFAAARRVGRDTDGRTIAGRRPVSSRVSDERVFGEVR